MALRKKGKYRYGDSQADLRDEIKRYSHFGYPADHFADARCSCGSTTFNLLLDDAQGVAIRTCMKCRLRHPIGDSGEYVDGAELEECACPCESEQFEISVGVSLYQDSQDVRWLYVGCRCLACGLTAVYGDWKNEFEGYSDLLANV